MSIGSCVGWGVSRAPISYWPEAFFVKTGFETSWQVPQNSPLLWKGLVMSQRVLLALTQAGVSREDAYRLVQRNAMKVWEQGADFKAELLADPEVTAALSPAEIEEKFDLGYHTKHVDTIFARVFGG